MENETNNRCSDEMGSKRWKYRRHGARGTLYFMGGIGAVIYYLQNAVGFGGVILAILKAMVWPAFLVYGVLKFLAA